MGLFRGRVQVVVLAGLLFGCNDSDQKTLDIVIPVDQEESQEEASTSFSYQVTSLKLEIEETLTPLLPAIDFVKGSLIGFEVTPELPSGLRLEAQTGTLWGTPSEISEQADYDVTLVTSEDRFSFTLSIEITDHAPASFTYSSASAIYVVDREITSNLPQFEEGGGLPTEFAIEPELPMGLNFNEASGEITGTPVEGQQSERYVITATNSGGSQTSEIEIRIGSEEQPILKVSTGVNTTCASVNGDLKCWGSNAAGAVNGNAGRSRFRFPVELSIDDSVSKLSGGSSYNCAIAGKGVYCWGLNNSFQAGPGGGLYDSVQRVPTLVREFDQTPTQIATGTFHACAVVQGALYCWGSNEMGQIGIDNALCQPYRGRFSACQTEPAIVPGFESGIVKVALSSTYFCALKSDGGVLCRGRNDVGQLGSGNADATSEAVQVQNLPGPATDVAVGLTFSCALVEGSIYCWGSNRIGMLGPRGTSNCRDRQNQWDRCEFTPLHVDQFSSNVLNFKISNNTMCALVGDERSLECRGLGNFANSNAFGFVQEALAALDAQGDIITEVEQFDLGYSHGCLIAQNRVQCWGDNVNQALGPLNTSSRQNYAAPAF